MSDERVIAALRKIVGDPPRPKANPLNIFALVCVAVMSIFIMATSTWAMLLLSDSRWCDVALGADKAVRGSNLDAARACVSLLELQIKAVSWNGLIAIAITAACLLALMVIVIANGQLSFALNRGGASGSMGQAGTALPPAPTLPAATATATATVPGIPPEEETPRP